MPTTGFGSRTTKASTSLDTKSGCRTLIKVLQAALFAMSMSQDIEGNTDFVLSRCARHLAENCREACSGRMNEDHKVMIIDLAKSRTEDVYRNEDGYCWFSI